MLMYENINYTHTHNKCRLIHYNVSCFTSLQVFSSSRGSTTSFVTVNPMAIWRQFGLTWITGSVAVHTCMTLTSRSVLYMTRPCDRLDNVACCRVVPLVHSNLLTLAVQWLGLCGIWDRGQMSQIPHYWCAIIKASTRRRLVFCSYHIAVENNKCQSIHWTFPDVPNSNRLTIGLTYIRISPKCHKDVVVVNTDMTCAI